MRLKEDRPAPVRAGDFDEPASAHRRLSGRHSLYLRRRYVFVVPRRVAMEKIKNQEARQTSALLAKPLK